MRNKTIAATALVTLALVALLGLAFSDKLATRNSQQPEAVVALQDSPGDCIQLYRNGVLLVADQCVATPTPTDTPVPPTPTETPTSTPPATFTPVATVTPPPTATATQEPTVAPTVTPEPTVDPLVHDTTACHGAETGDGHTHGYCVEDLPDGAIKDYLLANPLFAGVGQPWLSGATENMYPYPQGKHEGYKHLYQEFDECYQFGEEPGSDLCLKAVWLQVHSIGTADAARTPGGIHSLTIVAEACDLSWQNCGIFAGAEIEHYGEVHSQYKATDCPGVHLGVEYPDPYHNSQPPYAAFHVDGRDFLSRPARIFWSSLRNAVIVPHVGRVNNLVQVAWSENVFSVASADPAECHDPAHDRIWATSTDEGYINQYALWTIRAAISSYPRPFSGFTDRIGDPAPQCVGPSFACLTIYISETLPPGDINFNLPVRNADFVTPAGVIDITEANVHMPGAHD